jgi:nitronate monooxygenase
MSLWTPFTEALNIQHPVVLAPMGGSAGGALAAAVSNGGGLGLVGGGQGRDQEWIDHELAMVADQADKPWGIGFQAWSVEADTVRRALDYGPAAVMLSFGDPAPLTEPIHRAGVTVIVQVTDLEEARQALDVGAHIIVAQGSEAGGHGGRRATLPFVPVVVDLAAPVPVLAAGGIADGRGLAAALALGAAGALLGTRFQASLEALVPVAVSKAIIEGAGEDTERSCVLDIARGSAWPRRYTGRTLRNAFLDRWRDREDELSADTAARQEYRDRAGAGDLAVLPVWASEGIDLITSLLPAADLVALIAAEAQEALDRAGKRPGSKPAG